MSSLRWNAQTNFGSKDGLGTQHNLVFVKYEKRLYRKGPPFQKTHLALMIVNKKGYFA